VDAARGNQRWRQNDQDRQRVEIVSASPVRTIGGRWSGLVAKSDRKLTCLGHSRSITLLDNQPTCERLPSSSHAVSCGSNSCRFESMN